MCCKRLDQEALGLLALGYRRVLYVELNCKHCGCWRLGVDPDVPQISCPKCQAHDWKLTVLAHGFTRRELPLVEHYLAAPSRYTGGIRYHFTCSVPYLAELQHRKRLQARATKRTVFLRKG